MSESINGLIGTLANRYQGCNHVFQIGGGGGWALPARWMTTSLDIIDFNFFPAIICKCMLVLESTCYHKLILSYFTLAQKNMQ